MRVACLLPLAAAAAGAVEPECVAGKACPHIVFALVDDLGWNNVPWHNKDLEQTMPVSLALVKEGVELDRHYTYEYCSPTRSSLMSGRLPYHVNQINIGMNYPSAGIARGMTTIPRKLKDAGYRTHATGKWHCGAQASDQLPTGRGFDSHLGYLGGAEDHFTQRTCDGGPQGTFGDFNCMLPDPAPPPFDKNYSSPFFDLWYNDGPAYGRTGAFGDRLYTDFVVTTLRAHPPHIPIFFYVAFQSDHTPLQAPQAYVDKYPAAWKYERRVYAGMGAYWDEALGNITATLRELAMWEHTLLIVSGDNGGPVYASSVAGYGHCGGANNFPLFAGKGTSFEGGVRVAAFVAGGFVPAGVRGSRLTGNIHITDWFATFCGLAGVDAADPAAVKAGLPGVDAVDIWPLVSGANATSPRYELPLSVNGSSFPYAPVSALIVGDYKLVGGRYSSAARQAREWPTDTACCDVACWEDPAQQMDCGSAAQPTCLFDVRADPTEERNLHAERPDVASRMAARLRELAATVYAPQLRDTPSATAFVTMAARYKARDGEGPFVGPWLD